MTRIRTIKTNFTAGEVSPHLLGRGELRGYENGAARLRNVFIHPTGGLERRAGLRFIDRAPGAGRLVAFEFNTEQVYLLLFSAGRLMVYKDGAKVADLSPMPWTAAHLDSLAWTQSADTLFVCHADLPPQRITRTSDTAWTVEDFTFQAEGTGALRQPHFKFFREDVTLTPSGPTGSVTLTASANVFKAGHVGLRLRYEGMELAVTAYLTPTKVQANVLQTLSGTAASSNWTEQAFSGLRGWPATVTFHQDRLVFGGSRDLPNRIWMSRTADITNFDLGTGLDDEAIEFALLSDQVNAIRGLFSGRHLQVMTTGAEWMVSGEPMTPAKVQARRQTRVGSLPARNVPPRNVDGATLFVARNGRELREFLYTDTEQAYQAADLGILSRHLFRDPVDQDFDQSNRLFHMVMADGTLATLTIYRTEQVTAWTVQQTATPDAAAPDRFLAVAAVGEEVYLLVRRPGGVFVEMFDPAANTDSFISGTSATGAVTWSGLDHLEGCRVFVVADGIHAGEAVVQGGAVTLDKAAKAVEIGLPFTHEVKPLPPVLQTARGVAQGSPVRLVRALFRLVETQALRVDTGRGMRQVPFKKIAGGGVLDAAPVPFTGDKELRGLGWVRDPERPLWRIEQDTPLPCNLLSVTTEIKVND